MGNSMAHLATKMDTKKNRIAVELYIPNNKMLFTYLKDNEEELISDIGESIDWFEANIATGFNLYFMVNDVFNQSRKEEYFGWLYANVLKFKKVLTPYIQEFKSKENIG
jgi:hypothetical protein